MIFWRLKSLFNNPFLSLEVLKHFYKCVKQTKKGEAYENSKGATNVSNHVRYGYFGIFCYSPNFIFIKIDPNQSCFHCFFYPNRWLSILQIHRIFLARSSKISYGKFRRGNVSTWQRICQFSSIILKICIFSCIQSQHFIAYYSKSITRNIASIANISRYATT